MSPSHLDNSEFLSRLATLLSGAHDEHHASILLTQKRLTHADGETAAPRTRDDDFSDLVPPTSPLPLLVRATNAKRSKTESGRKNDKKVKISTIVQPVDVATFFEKYSEVCKAGMSGGLKKRDRKARKAKKKKAGDATTKT